MAEILQLENEFHLWVSTHTHTQKHAHAQTDWHTTDIHDWSHTHACWEEQKTTHTQRETCKHTQTEMRTYRHSHKQNIHPRAHTDEHTHTHWLSLSHDLFTTQIRTSLNSSPYITILPIMDRPITGCGYRLRLLLLFSTATRALIIEKPLGPPARSQRADNDRTHLWGENKDNDTRRWCFHAWMPL